mgnify:CR=1 FL=1
MPSPTRWVILCGWISTGMDYRRHLNGVLKVLGLLNEFRKQSKISADSRFQFSEQLINSALSF